jgi:hypothetical protein
MEAIMGHEFWRRGLIEELALVGQFVELLEDAELKSVHVASGGVHFQLNEPQSMIYGHVAAKARAEPLHLPDVATSGRF